MYTLIQTCMRGWRNTVGNLIEMFRLNTAYRGPHFIAIWCHKANSDHRILPQIIMFRAYSDRQWHLPAQDFQVLGAERGKSFTLNGVYCSVLHRTGPCQSCALRCTALSALRSAPLRCAARHSCQPALYKGEPLV